MFSRQLELGFENRPALKGASRGRRRASRANWWFDQMRGVVSDAREWPTSALEAPPSDAVSPRSGPPPTLGTPRASGSVKPDDEVDPESASELHRWRFS